MNQPKGTLIAIGGALNHRPKEDGSDISPMKAYKTGILNNIIQLFGQKGDPIIELLTTASLYPDETAKEYRKAFRKIGCKNIGHLKIIKRKDADKNNFTERLRKCGFILKAGGDQFRLSSVLGGTEFLQVLKQRYENEEFVIGGTSAGAAAMSSTMISGGASEHPYLKGGVELKIGFGLIDNVVFDTHFDKRARFGRLFQTIAGQPGAIGVGLCENAGVIISKGTILKVIGANSVVIIDGSKITKNNIANIHEGEPLSVGNVLVHSLSEGDRYDIEKRSLL
ncbi:MAG: cyanophycinase [Chitinophagaceae bacterium]|nr:cyanophycinase [Chitinophagaceae bacterium]